MITATQLTVELDAVLFLLDAVLFLLNRKITRKEPQTWTNELRLQGIPDRVLRGLHTWVADQRQGTLRAKKAVFCLLWITDWSVAEIEQILTQCLRSHGRSGGTDWQPPEQERFPQATTGGSPHDR